MWPPLGNIQNNLPDYISVVDPNVLNLEPDPGFWLNLDPDLGLYINFERKKIPSVESLNCDLKSYTRLPPFYPIFSTCVDPYSEYGSGSRKLLNMDPDPQH